jgi:methionyl-tRNA formyltransferase
MDRIAFAGYGHGGIVAFKSLQSRFNSIEVLTSDLEIISLLRSEDYKIKSLKDCNSSLVVCAGYHEIVSKNILKNKTIINTHPSLLPKYRGMHSLVWAMLNFEEELGFTVHLMNEYIDDGDILEQFSIKYTNQTSREVMLQFDDYVLNNLGRIVQDFLRGKIAPQKQNKTLATWTCKRNIEDCVIDFEKSNRYIRMLFKALTRPYPLPMIKAYGDLYEVVSCTVVDSQYEMHIGRVVNIESNKVFIKISEGVLVIDSLINYETKEKVKAISLFRIGQRI